MIPRSGGMNLEQLESLLQIESAAVYFENPSYLGFLEIHSREITDLAHKHGALAIVSVDPISLGVLAPPVRYGADIVCGDIQPLGMHMQYGGGQAGFIASRDDEKIVMQYPSRLFGISPTRVPGEYGFGDVAYDRTSFAKREEGNRMGGHGCSAMGHHCRGLPGVDGAAGDEGNWRRHPVPIPLCHAGDRQDQGRAHRYVQRTPLQGVRGQLRWQREKGG